MFVLAELQDIVEVKPDHFSMKLADAVRDELNKKLANKVILNVGLCLALKDIVSMNNSFILPGDGSSHTRVTFRYIVFRPAIGDILQGRIRSCTREGVFITLGFFDDILIPPAALQHPSRFEEAEQAWVWEYVLETGDKHDLFMDIGETVKFRVANEVFEESLPTGPPRLDMPRQSSMPLIIPEQKIPYRLMGSITESGLGVTSWWDQKHSEEPEEAEEEASENK